MNHKMLNSNGLRNGLRDWIKVVKNIKQRIELN